MSTSEELIRQLTERLEYHINQLCDEENCVTAEHISTRALVARAGRWLDGNTGFGVLPSADRMERFLDMHGHKTPAHALLPRPDEICPNCQHLIKDHKKGKGCSVEHLALGGGRMTCTCGDFAL